MPRPTYANVMATLAVVLSLTMGTAYAAGLGPHAVKSNNIASNAVHARHIQNGAVKPGDLATGSVGSRAIADGSVGAPELAPDSVGSSELGDSSVGKAEIQTDAVGQSEIADGVVDGARIEDGSITGTDVAPDSISSTRMTVGVKNLLFNAGTLAVNQTFDDFTVSNSSWPGGAPSSGAQISASWTQPADTLDVVFATARVAYPAACSETSSADGRGFDVKITDAGDRVISASSPQRTDGVNYNGNGFWSQQVALDGVPFRTVRTPDNPAAFVDYVHLPIELSEFATGSAAANRSVRFFFKRNSSACSPEITGTRVVVYRFA